MSALVLSEVFEGHPLTFVSFKGEPVVVARELAAALGYVDPSKIGEKIRGDWSADFREGEDFRLLDGDDLSAFKAAWPDTPVAGASTLTHTRRSLLILTESGLWMVAQKTEKELGVKLRRFLAEKVLPKLARGEGIPSAAPMPEPTPDPLLTLREVRLYAAAMHKAGRSRDEIAAFMRTQEQRVGLVFAAAPTPEPPTAQLPLPPAAPIARPETDADILRRWIRRRGLATFSARQAFTENQGHFETMEPCRAALDVLVRAGEIRLGEASARGRGRPPSPTYRVTVVNSTIRAFLGACCIVGREEEDMASRIYEAFCAWSDSQGEVPRSHKWLSQHLSAAGFTRKARHGNAVGWVGLAVKAQP
jgi:prophage antirepressor-like protein